MKTNAFGDPILQPGDDVGAAFLERYDLETDARLTARFIEKDDNFNWCCTIEDEDGNEIAVHDFESEGDLRHFLTKAQVDIED